MPCTRPVRRFYLTPPKVLTFIISLVLAVLALLAVYGNLAPLLLAAGTLVRGI
jgi:hypothetical protein